LHFGQSVWGVSAETVSLQREHSRFLMVGISTKVTDGPNAK
jgi:hypothetical protein